ncbi:hypothetical protein [Pantoea ananatis]
MSQGNLREVFTNKLKDADLLFIAELVNRTNYGIGVTLFVKGALITGFTVSGSEYYGRQINSLGEFSDHEISQDLLEHFKEGQSHYQDKGEQGFSYPANFLHLRDVSFKLGEGKVFPMSNGILRVKIEEVDGFALGFMSNN